MKYQYISKWDEDRNNDFIILDHSMGKIHILNKNSFLSVKSLPQIQLHKKMKATRKASRKKYNIVKKDQSEKHFLHYN